MKKKKSFGSCKATTVSVDTRQLIHLTPTEASRLLVVLQSTVGKIMATENRQTEQKVSLSISPRKGDGVTITVYRHSDTVDPLEALL